MAGTLRNMRKGLKDRFCALSVNRSLIFQTHKAMSENMFFFRGTKGDICPLRQFRQGCRLLNLQPKLIIIILLLIIIHKSFINHA
jgi:hypothetical protein